jgi:pseudouridine kinase
MKIKDKIGSFHTIKPNKIEAELLTDMKIETVQDMIRASEYFLDRGVKRVFITLGSEGVFYNDGVTHNLIPNPKVDVVNTTGAGDAFAAALAFCYFNNYDIDTSARFSMATAILALSCEETINPNISKENVYKKMKEIGLC